MSGRIVNIENVESLASDLVSRYPTGFLSEPELLRWEASPWAIAIRVPGKGCLDSPVAIIRGSYLDIRAFEIAFERVRREKVATFSYADAVTLEDVECTA